MLIVALFTALSTMLTAAAPLPAYLGTSVAEFGSHTLYRRAPPTFDAPDHLVPPHDKPDTLARMEHHYDTRATDAQREAQLVSAASHWTPVSNTRESMAISYHTGGNTGSPIIGSLGQIHRKRPVPEINLDNVRVPHRDEVKKASLKRFREHDFGPGEAGNVKSIKVLGNWDPDGGLRDKTKMTFHSADGNTIGPPVTVNRPLTLNLPVPSWVKASAESQVRKAHAKMAADPNHQFSKANYGTVLNVWHDRDPVDSETRNKPVVVAFEHVSEHENTREYLGQTTVPKPGRPAPPSHAGPSHASPIELPLAHPAHSDQDGSVGPPPASSSSSEGSHYNTPGSPNSDSEATSRFIPNRKTKTS